MERIGSIEKRAYTIDHNRGIKMTFRKPERKDFPENYMGDGAYETYKDSDGCDDGKPPGWSPCKYPSGKPCLLYGTKDCYHKQGVKK